MASVSGELDFNFSGFGLTPGKKYELSVAYLPDDASDGVNTGAASQTVKTNGTVKYGLTLEELIGGATTPGVLRAWLREQGTDFNGEPITVNGTPAVVEVQVPK